MLQSDDIISILELFESGHSYREIRIVYSVGNSSLCRIRQKAQESAVHSEDLKKMSAQQVIELFYPKASVACTCDKTLPDFEKIYQRMKNPEIHTSLISEWESYKKENPGGYQYTSSRFTTIDGKRRAIQETMFRCPSTECLANTCIWTGLETARRW